MSEILLAPIDILNMWVNEVKFSIYSPIEGDLDQGLSLKLSVRDVSDADDARPDTYQISLAVKCEVTPVETGEKAATARVTVGCLVAPEAVENDEKLNDDAKRLLLVNGISFAYGEARSRIAELFERSLAKRRVDIQPVLPGTILDHFNLAEAEGSQDVD